MPPREPSNRRNPRLEERHARAPAPSRAQATKRSSAASRRSRRRGEDLLLIARLAIYAVLVFLTAQVAVMSWDAVQLKRAEVAATKEPPEVPFPRQSILQEGEEGWADPALAAAVERAILPGSGVTSVYVKSLNNGATAEIGSERSHLSASLFKVPVLVEVFRQQEAGLLTLATPVRLQQRHWTDGAGVLQARIGEQLTVRELLDLMVRVSDNIASLALLDLVGTDNVNLTLQANGLQTTRLRVGNPKRDWGGRAGENTTSAREMGILLERLATGKLLKSPAADEAIRLLAGRHQVSWLPTRLPQGVAVARKSGELVGVRHEAGIVYGARSQFVVVVLNDEVGDYDAAAASISGVARAAYDYLNR